MSEELRGILAANLKCWHRLTGDEAKELVEFCQSNGLTGDGAGEVLAKVAKELTRMFGTASFHVRGEDQEIVGYTVKTGALHHIVGVLSGCGYQVIIPTSAPLIHESLSGVFLHTSEPEKDVLLSELAELRSIISATSPQQKQATPGAVPEGYVLVPIEPTPSMIVKGCIALHDASQTDLVATDGEIVSLYCAMILAAPKPQDKEPG